MILKSLRAACFHAFFACLAFCLFPRTTDHLSKLLSKGSHEIFVVIGYSIWQSEVGSRTELSNRNIM